MNIPRRRRTSTGGGASRSGVSFYEKVEGDGLGDQTISTADTWTDITDLTVDLMEVSDIIADDIILVTFECQMYISTGTNTFVQFRFDVNGTNHPSDRGLATIIGDTNSHEFSLTETFQVTQAMIDAGSGTVTVKAQASYSIGEGVNLVIRNDGTNGTPIFTVTNLGAIAA